MEATTTIDINRHHKNLKISVLSEHACSKSYDRMSIMLLNTYDTCALFTCPGTKAPSLVPTLYDSDCEVLLFKLYG